MNRLRKKIISRRKAIRLIGSSSVLLGLSSKINAKNVSDVIIIGANLFLCIQTHNYFSVREEAKKEYSKEGNW